MTADPLEVQVHALAVGGDGVARDAEGRVVFVEGALPGERVQVRLRSEQARFAKGVVVEVVEAAPERVAPVCPHRQFRRRIEQTAAAKTVFIRPLGMILIRGKHRQYPRLRRSCGL